MKGWLEKQRIAFINCLPFLMVIKKLIRNLIIKKFDFTRTQELEFLLLLKNV
jgi:hypothetical protein